ncbi:MAG: hypothetical protein NVS2B7_29600 [Herpetosiphon sp.]
MACEQRFGFEQDHELTQPRPTVTGHPRQLASDDQQRQFLLPRDTRGVRLFALEDAQLVPEEQDLNIFVMTGSTDQQDEVKERRQGACDEQEDHGSARCRERADP